MFSHVTEHEKLRALLARKKCITVIGKKKEKQCKLDPLFCMGYTTGSKQKDITFNQKSSFEESEIRQAIARQDFTFQGLPSRYTNNFCKTNANNSNNSTVVKVLSYG